MAEYLYIEGERIDSKSLEPFTKKLDQTDNKVLRPTIDFLREWWSKSDSMLVQTSGSTGRPKQIELSKEAMRRSAIRSNRYFDIKAGMELLLAMDIRYIGAKMMVIRALLAGAKLSVVPPSSHPLATLTEAPHFLSFVPLQLHHTLQVPRERHLLSQAKSIIIGGGALHPSLEEELLNFPSLSAYATYGMTETISHIALRKLNGSDARDRFYPLEGVKLSRSEEGQLIIRDTLLFPDQAAIVTNDLVELYPDGGFTVEGRADNIINSGGIKISPEQVERQLSQELHMSLACTWVPDSALGQRMVLVLEGSSLPPRLTEKIDQLLPPYHRPKEIRLLPHLPHNANGKLDRHALHQLIC